ncbi:YegJ family protein [Pedobacter sp. GSP4]|uniref:YegJ family protein n=1 Tax=Pedobacter sp. GSP4 TaxID=3453716 RepID=UPI003EEFEEF4
MGLLSRIFGKKSVEERKGEPDVVLLPKDDAKMEWAIQKAGLTLWRFEESLKNPLPYQQYFSIKVLIMDGDEGEHIWLTDPHFDEEGNLFGTVGNTPVNVRSVKLNQKIGIKRDSISDWMIIEHGRLIGGYTIRAIRDEIPDQDKAAFDKQINLHIDEGVDYFKCNLETPEGAILSLEKAYNYKDINAAMDCKDFYEEAKSLLSVMNMDLDKHIISETAEVLKLSFLKNIEEHGFPDFSGVKNAFPVRNKISETHWVITEVCWHPDGKKSVQLINTYKSPRGWVVLGPAAEPLK